MSRTDDHIRDLAIVAGSETASPGDPRIQDLVADGRFAAAWGKRTTIKRDSRRAVHVVTIGDCAWLAKAEQGSWPRTLASWFRPGTVPAALHHRLGRLRAEGLRVPASIGVLRLSLHGGGEQWVHIMQFLALARTAHQVLSESAAGSDSLLIAIVDQLVLLHRLNRFHGDMKLTNIMVREGIPYLVDVDGRRCRGPRRRQKDLARLLVGCAEAGVPPAVLRDALHHYAERMQQSPDRLLPAVKAIAVKIARRHQRAYGRASAVAELPW